jgi:hypothetical protein
VCVAQALPLAAQRAPAALDSSDVVVPGTAIQRDFGALTLTVLVDAKVAQAQVAFALGGRTVQRSTLTLRDPTLVFNLVSGADSARGSLAARFTWPGGASTVWGDFRVSSAGSPLPYRGDVATWQSPPRWTAYQSTVWVTPELNVDTDVLFGPEQPVQVRFVAGTVVFHTVTLSQGANDVVVTRGFAIGTVRVEPGMTLHLQPATPTQSGEVLLTGTFSSSNLPRVDYSGAVAVWPWIPPP